MPEYTVVTRMTIQHTVLSSEDIFSSIITMHTIVDAVLTFPDIAAAMTLPSAAAIMRIPLTANSRISTMASTHAGMSPQATSISIAAVTSALSASGSMNLPKSVTSPRLRAMCPSR
jgi:hypothetical protein